jgi:hypothetical protein
LHSININIELKTVFKFSKKPLEKDLALGLSIFTEHFEEATEDTRKKIYLWLQKEFLDASVLYLEFLVENGDSSLAINTFLWIVYLEKAETESKSDEHRERFSKFVFSCKYYNSKEVLERYV